MSKMDTKDLRLFASCGTEGLFEAMLTDCKLELSPRLLAKLAEVLKVNTTLTEIRLQKNNISTAGLDALIDTLEVNWRELQLHQ